MPSPPRPSVPSPRSVLVVEDQDDVRLMLVTVLNMEGYRVDEARNAAEGLECLKAHRYDLVLTDYAMPGKTGTWMLQEAAKAGRLDGTPALVVTAHPELVQAASEYTVVGKPVDLDSFLQQITRILHVPENGEAGLHARPETAKLELVLYISAASPSSMVAQANMERVLAGFTREEIAYSTCDLQINPDSAERDRVVFTPTLVKRWPEPRLWVIGDLRDGEIVADLLRSAGVSASS
jgi:CheY-like chemotaxis protein